MALFQTKWTSYSFIHDVRSHLSFVLFFVFFDIKKSWQKEDSNPGRRNTKRLSYPLGHRRPTARILKRLAINPNLSIKANRKQP